MLQTKKVGKETVNKKMRGKTSQNSKEIKKTIKYTKNSTFIKLGLK